MPSDSAEAGRWETSRTPYVLPLCEAHHSRAYKRIFAMMMAQGGKSQFLFNIIGSKLDDDPQPILYIAPTKTSLTTVVEPKIDAMIRGCRSLWQKTVKGKKYTTMKKLVGGTSFRMAWAGSTTEIKSDAAATVMIDEVDEIAIERKGQGSIVPLADARHKSFADGITLGASTPTIGTIEPKFLDTGLEHWLPSKNVQSPIWKLWQAGTCHEWTWPCPHCLVYFIPRFKWLKWDEGATSVSVLEKEAAWIECPNCSGKIFNDDREEINAVGTAISPHQHITKAKRSKGKYIRGTVSGDGIQSTDYTLWVSGLCNPFMTLGDLASNWLRAVRSHDDEEIKAVLNTDMGECYSLGGEAPTSEEVKSRKKPYRVGEVPEGIRLVVVGVDVQKDRLYYVVRGFGFGYESWLLQFDEIWGNTEDTEVWQELDALLETEFGGLPVRRMGVDSGYRKDAVYSYCRTNRSKLKAMKGSKSQDKPYHGSKVDVNEKGKILKKSLMLWHFCSDTAKSWVHGRINRNPDLGGQWHIPSDVTDDYCSQIIAEERIEKRNGGFEWMLTSKNNHYLDCEAIAYIMARMSHTLLMRPDKKPAEKPKPTVQSTLRRAKKKRTKKSFVKNW